MGFRIFTAPRRFMMSAAASTLLPSGSGDQVLLPPAPRLRFRRQPIGRMSLGFYDVPSCLRRAKQEPIVVLDIDLLPIHLFLATDAKCRPRQGMNPLHGDLFFAVQANAVRASRNTRQCTYYQPKHVRFPVETTNRKFLFPCQLHFIERIRRFLYNDTVSVAYTARKIGLSGFEGGSVSV
jgi:hypothetical protein